MNIKELGEQGLVERIRRRLTAKDDRILVGIGDDCAAIKPPPKGLLIMTTDSFVAGVHFDTSYFTYRQIGIKALAASLSDIASMGGAPTGGLLSLFLPSEIRVEDVDEIITGILEVENRFHMRLVGGNTVRSPILSLSMTILGEVEKSKLTLRSGAKVGDLLCVTGDLGRSQAGLIALRKDVQLNTPTLEAVTRSHLEPVPRIPEARVLVESVRVHSMIDLSDGLSIDLVHLSRESGVGAKIEREKIPIADETRAVANAVEKDPLDFALYGGEDFELLLTLSKVEVEKGRRAMEEETGTRLTVIGEILPKKEGIQLVDRQGEIRLMRIESGGFRHF